MTQGHFFIIIISQKSFTSPTDKNQLLVFYVHLGSVILFIVFVTDLCGKIQGDKTRRNGHRMR